MPEWLKILLIETGAISGLVTIILTWIKLSNKNKFKKNW